MTKKKKTASKQSKQNLQKPSGKPGQQSSSPKKNTSETAVKKDAQPNPVQSKEPQAQSAKTNEKEPEQGAAKSPKSEPPKTKSEITQKSDLKSAPQVAKESADKAAANKGTTSKETASKETVSKETSETPKQGSKASAARAVEATKPKDAKPSAKGEGKGGKSKKKDKAPRQSVSVEKNYSASPEEVDAASQDVSATPQDVSAAPQDVSATLQDVSAPDAQPSQTGAARKVAKTLIEGETELPSGKEVSNGDANVEAEPPSAVSTADSPSAATTTSSESTPPAAPDASRKIAKTMLEVDIGSLKQATAKATGAEIKEEAPAPQERKVAKTLMEVSTDGLRDAVEASSRAIEDEIAAAIKEAESLSPPEPAEKEKTAEPVSEKPVEKLSADKPIQPSERRIAKTIIDVRAIDLFELANSEIDTLVEEDPPAQAPAEKQRAESAAEPPAKPPETQPRKVAKTMLEIDVPDLGAVLEAGKSAAEEPVAQAKPPNLSEVSMEDLSAFAQALKEDKPMDAPTARAERLRKTMLGICRNGLSSRASLPGMKAPAERIESSSPKAGDSHAPVHISRSLHPLDNFSFDNLCPADEEEEASQQPLSQVGDLQSFAPDEPSQPHRSEVERKPTGTVEMQHDPHTGGSEQDFKGVSTVWPHDQEHSEQNEQPRQEKHGKVAPERYVAKTMLDMDFLKESLSASVMRAEEKMAESIALKMAEPPKPTITKDDYKVAQVGCPFVWAEGDSPKEKVRYCTNCHTQIYNFAGLDLAEAQALIFKRENHENAPIFKREDGKFMTRDCPIALKKQKDKVMMIVGGVLIVVLLGAMFMFMPQAPPPVPPPAVTDTPMVAPGTTKTGTNTNPSSKVAVPPLTTGTKEMSTKDGKGGLHYVRGKGIVEQAPVIVTPPAQPDTTVPGTSSGYDEGGSFWKYTDKGNN